MFLLREKGGEAARTIAEEVLTKPVPSPSGVQKEIYTASAEGASLMGWMGWDGMGWMGRKIKWVLQFSSYFFGI